MTLPRNYATGIAEAAYTPSPQPEASHIGPRLRAQREQMGLSLREVARRIGVSASLISQIERDKVNPSVSTLYALVRELGLTMGDLFAIDDVPFSASSRPEPAGSEGPVVTAERRAVIKLASGVTWERLTSIEERRSQ